MPQLRRRARGTALLALAAALLLAAPSSAHVERPAGPYRVELGWGNEPAVAGVENFVQVELADAAGAPVAAPAGALSAEVSYGGRATTVPLAPAEEPGELRGALSPTLPGTYSFAISGSVDGHAIDVRATCGEATFDCVESGSSAEFPVRTPTAAELAQRLERESSRATDAEDRADGARTLAIVALALAALALTTAVTTARRARGRSERS